MLNIGRLFGMLHLQELNGFRVIGWFPFFGYVFLVS